MEMETKMIREVCFGNEPNNKGTEPLLRNDRAKSTPIIGELIIEFNCPNCGELFRNKGSVSEAIKQLPEKCPKCKVLWIVTSRK